jgi:L-ascorbate metabolism protein UlaG (beta-lactamase superfamily)
MKKNVLFLVLINMLLVLKAQDAIEITSIANDGFLITTDTTKVIIDGIFAKGNINFAYPPDEILTKERNAEEPFDSIDFILNSHYHADHLNAGYVLEHMINDTLPVFIGPKQSYDLMAAVSNFDTVQNRVLSISPATGVKIDTTIKGWNFKISKFIHHNDNSNQYQVNAYVFSMNNIRIFHPGDGRINNMDELQALNLDEDSIDIAFIPFWIVGDDLETVGRQVISYLNPKIIIIMHVWVSEHEFYKNRINEIDNLPPIYYLDKALDKLSIVKSGDSLIVENEPVSVSEMSNPALIHIYPNPSNGVVYIEPIINNSKKSIAEVYTLQGQLLAKRTLDNNHLTTLDFSGYTKGVYFLSVHVDSQVLKKKVIIH